MRPLGRLTARSARSSRAWAGWPLSASCSCFCSSPFFSFPRFFPVSASCFFPFGRLLVSIWCLHFFFGIAATAGFAFGRLPPRMSRWANTIFQWKSNAVGSWWRASPPSQSPRSDEWPSTNRRELYSFISFFFQLHRKCKTEKPFSGRNGSTGGRILDCYFPTFLFTDLRLSFFIKVVARPPN